MKRCRYFCLVLLFLLLIPQWPVEQNWWKKPLSKVSPHKKHPFANTHRVSAARSCLPTAKYFRVSPCARWDVEQKLQWEGTLILILPIGGLCVPALCSQPSVAQSSSSHTALFGSSQRGCSNALKIFCSLQPPTVHVTAVEAKAQSQ